MAHVPHQLVESINNAFFRRIAPPRPEDLIPDEEFKQIEMEAERYKKRSIIVGFPLIGTLSAAIAIGLYSVSLSLDGPAVNSAYDNRSWFLWLLPGVLGALAIVVLGEYFYCTNLNPSLGDQLRKYYATKKGCNAPRLSLITGVFFLLFAFLLAILFPNLTEVVDENGIRIGRDSHAYSDVHTIGLYDQLNAPIGVRDVFNLEIVFNKGSPLRMMENKGNRKLEILERIAGFVSEKSGVPVTRERMRPG